LQLKNGKNISGNIKAVFSKLGTTNVHHRRKRDKGSKHSSHIVLIPIIKLAAVDGAGLRQKLGISVFFETAPAVKLLPW